MPDGSNLILPSQTIAADFWRLFSPADPTIRLRFVHYDWRAKHPSKEVEGTLDEVWPHLIDYQSRGYEAYYFPNLVKPGTDGFATDQDVQTIRALFVDQDEGGLFDHWECHTEPSLRVLTSRKDGTQKGQLIWLIDGTSTFADDQCRLIAHYKSDPKLSNPSRILRLPGSLHQKDPSRPQLVTFDAGHVGRRERSAILAGLPETPPETERGPAGDRRPVAEILLRETLSYIDPPASEPEWFEVLAMIAGTELLGDTGQVARDWSAGKLDRRGKYLNSAPPGYDGDEAVDAKMERLRLDRGEGKPAAGFGSLVRLARLAGMPPPPKASELFTWTQQDNAEFLLRPRDLFAWPDPAELVEDFLMQGEDACLYSPPKSGKTFVALDIALSLAAGLPVLGKLRVLRPGEAVVYLSGEGHAGMKRRIAAWYQTHDIPLDRDLPFFYKTNVPVSIEGNADALRYVEGIRAFCTPVLIVIDTMARSLGKLDESTSASAALYLDVTKALRDAFACTTLTLAHEGKTGGKGVRGSSAFTAGFDAVWYLEADKANQTAMLSAEWLKDADELGPHCFRVETVYVDGMENNKGAVLRWIEISSHKPKKAAQDGSLLLLAQVRALLLANKVHDPAFGWTHAQVAEALMTTPRPPKDGDINTTLDWQTAYQAQRRLVRNLPRGAEAKRMGCKRVLQSGEAAEWVWYLMKNL